MAGVDFNITVIDNASAALDTISNRFKRTVTEIKYAEDYLGKVKEEQAKVQEEGKKTDESLKQNQINAIGTLTAINTLSSGVRLVSYSILRLDFVSEENRETVMKLVAAFQLLAGVVSIVKALTLATEAMGVASLKVAIVKTYTAILDAPWKAALVGGILGATAGVGAGLMMGGSNTSNNNTTNINYYQPTPEQDANNRIITQIVNGNRI